MGARWDDETEERYASVSATRRRQIEGPNVDTGSDNPAMWWAGAGWFVAAMFVYFTMGEVDATITMWVISTGFFFAAKPSD